MDQLLSFLSTMAAIFGGGEPLNAVLIRFILKSLMNPVQPDLLAQSYFDQLSFFVMIGLVGIALEIPFRIYWAIKGEDAATELKEFLISFGFIFVFVSMMPAFLLSWQAGFNTLAKTIAVSLTGSEDPSVLIKQLSELTGNPAVDFWLTILQMMFLFTFGITLVIMPVFLAVSGCLIVLGVSLRWVKHVGLQLFHFSMSLTVYSVFGNGLNMLLIGLLSWAVKINYSNNQFAYGLANTAIFGIAAVVTIVLLWKFKNQVNALVSGMVKTIAQTSAAVKETYQKVAGAGDRQIKASIAARTGRSKGSSLAGADKFKTDPSESSQPELATSSGTTLTMNRNSTAIRSSSRVSDLAPLAGAAAAVYLKRTPGTVINAGRAAQQVIKKDVPEPPAASPAVPSQPTAKPAIPAVPPAKPAVTAPPKAGPNSQSQPKAMRSDLAKAPAPAAPAEPPRLVTPPVAPQVQAPPPVQPPAAQPSPALKRADVQRPKPDLDPPNSRRS